MLIPPRLIERIPQNFGPEGQAWLDALPDRIRALSDDWSLVVGPPLDADNHVSWVAPVDTRDGGPAVLKIGYPHDEARYEADCLRAWNGGGAIRLFRVSEDGFTLLVERCIPGHDLWTLPADEGDAVAAALLARLWTAPPAGVPFDRIHDVASRWCEELSVEGHPGGYDADSIARCIEVARHLLATAPPAGLVHGDFHPANVLAAEREPWLVIDPKPILAEPAFALAQWLGNRVGALVSEETGERQPAAVDAMRRQIDRWATRLDLDPERIAGWTFVKSLGWDWSPHVVRFMRDVLDTA